MNAFLATILFAAAAVSGCPEMAPVEFIQSTTTLKALASSRRWWTCQPLALCVAASVSASVTTRPFLLNRTYTVFPFENEATNFLFSRHFFKSKRPKMLPTDMFSYVKKKVRSHDFLHFLLHFLSKYFYETHAGRQYVSYFEFSRVFFFLQSKLSSEYWVTNM